MKEVNKLRNICRVLSIILPILLLTIAVTGCCPTDPVPDRGSPVGEGAIDENGDPAPEGAVCASGNTCADPGKGCGLFPYRDLCTNTWNSVTRECECVCGD